MNEEVQVLAGKINHYSNLVRGKFERSLITHTVEEKKAKQEVIVIGKQARVQMTWWLLNLRALGIEGAFISDPDSWFPRWMVSCSRTQPEGIPRMCGRVGGVVTPG